MTTVFVHGVPETTVVWSPLVDALGIDDAITLALPGFGCNWPDGFGATMHEYADWLTTELESLDAPIHLVSHDWGALLSLRVLAENPGLVASWVNDTGNLTDDFEWHDTARIWQTPGDGEAFFAGVIEASEADRAALLASLGISESVAVPMAKQVDQLMADSILALYRSALEIGPEWGPGIDKISVPTLVVDAGLDAYGSEGSSAALAARVGGSTGKLDDAGHWWMTTHPAEAAAAIQGFWSGLA